MSSSCYSLVNGSWIVGPNMIDNEQIGYAGFAPFPDLSDDHRLFRAGGFTIKGVRAENCFITKFRLQISKEFGWVTFFTQVPKNKCLLH